MRAAEPSPCVFALAFHYPAAAALRPAALASGSLDFQIQVGAVELRASVNDGELKVVQIAPPAPSVGGLLPSGEAELRFATGPGNGHLIAGTLTPAQAVKHGVVTILTGNQKLLGRFTESSVSIPERVN